jgi:hypothetical protein
MVLAPTVACIYRGVAHPPPERAIVPFSSTIVEYAIIPYPCSALPLNFQHRYGLHDGCSQEQDFVIYGALKESPTPNTCWKSCVGAQFLFQCNFFLFIVWNPPLVHFCIMRPLIAENDPPERCGSRIAIALENSRHSSERASSIEVQSPLMCFTVSMSRPSASNVPSWRLKRPTSSSFPVAR